MLHPGTRTPNRAPSSLSPAASLLTMLSHLPDLLWLPSVIMTVERPTQHHGSGSVSLERIRIMGNLRVIDLTVLPPLVDLVSYLNPAVWHWTLEHRLLWFECNDHKSNVAFHSASFTWWICGYFMRKHCFSAANLLLHLNYMFDVLLLCHNSPHVSMKVRKWSMDHKYTSLEGHSLQYFNKQLLNHTTLSAVFIFS